MKPSSRELVIEAARRLFAERGYPSVTIRQIAAEAGLSASMVMKVGGNKAKIYQDALPTSLEHLDITTPRNLIGKSLADRMLLRREKDMAEPWAQAIFRTADSPDPQSTREEFQMWVRTHLTKWVDPGPDLEARVELLACLILGLAVGLRTQRLLGRTPDPWIAEHYGRLMQQVIDADVTPGSSENPNS
jgi:AcrR family transcriptional regulator